jgi:hypothetical protein
MPAQPNPHSSGPYRFDGWAGPEFTVTRPETGALISLVEDGRRVYIDGPRRCGKTTLAINALAEMGLKALKIDLEGVCSKSGLVDRVATETYGFLRDNPTVEKALSGKRGVKASAEGNVLSVLKFSLESSSENDRKGPTTLSDLLSAVTTVARVAKAAVIVDEFQAANHPQLVNASEVVGDFASASDPLRTKNEVAWLFLGSHRHIMHQIFHGTGSSFLQRTQHLGIGPIEEKLIIPFLNERSGREVAAAVGPEAYRWTEGIPGDLQRLYDAALRGAESVDAITLNDLENGKVLVLHELGGLHFEPTLARLEQESPQEMDMLRLIAQEDIRSPSALAAVTGRRKIKEKVVEHSLDALVKRGFLHFNRSKQLLERPEPMMFHFIQHFDREHGGGHMTAKGALHHAFRKLPTPRPAHEFKP